jgi:DNA-binding CsgD family transcriptional regulator
MKNENKFTPFIDASPDENGYNPSKFQASHPVKTNDSKLSENDPSLLFDYCLVDHSGRQFACIYDHCQEQSICFQSKLLQQKLDFHELSFHPEDRKLWCDEAFPDFLRFINSEPFVEYTDYRFIFNHRYIRKDGSVSQFMHEGSLTFNNEKRTPAFNLNVFFEIADIKSDETMILTIFRYSTDQGYQKVFTKVYSNNNHSNLTPRELEIIKLCHEGLSSKMIADRLSLSIHTVKNHKRNMMDKTLTHNISELIHLCIKNRWL